MTTLLLVVLVLVAAAGFLWIASVRRPKPDQPEPPYSEWPR
jgi:hypothetical protein